AHGHEQLRDGDAGGAGAVDGDAQLARLPACQAAGVEDAGGDDDGGTVLVVVEDGDVGLLAQHPLDVEAARRADVFQIDPAKGRLQLLDDVDNLVGVLSGDADGEG